MRGNERGEREREREREKAEGKMIGCGRWRERMGSPGKAGSLRTGSGEFNNIRKKKHGIRWWR